MVKSFKGLVVSIESAGCFMDGKPRVTVRLEGCDDVRKEVRFPVEPTDPSGFRLDDVVVVTMSPVRTDEC